MGLKIKLILIGLLLILFDEAKCAEERHPHGQAELLIQITRKGEIAKFTANKEMIEKTFMHPEVKDRKIVVFSIIGAYREGKSFFLGYCLRYLYATYGSINKDEIEIVSNDWLGDKNDHLLGFTWAHGTKANTKGLMMWSDVFLYDAPDGEKIAIVIIDTQGLFEKGSPQEENAKIFSFSTLVSSIQVINIMHRIQENQIAHLQTAIKLTNLITMKQQDQGISKKKAFQKLIFLLRDFEDDNFEFGFEGGQKYFDDFFENVEQNELTYDDDERDSREDFGEQLTIAEVNRNSIRDSFDEIFCFLLNFPGQKIKNKNFKGQWGVLNPEFVENLKILIESLLAPEKLIKKTVLGTEINGEKFKDILMALSESISSYKIPQVDNIFQIFIDTQMSAIVKEKVKNYKAAMTNERIEYDRSDFVEWLQRKHNESFSQAIDEFLSAEKINDKLGEEKFKKALEDEIEDFFIPFEKLAMETFNVLQTEKKMRSILRKKSAEYRKNINEEVNYDHDNFEHEINERHENFKKVSLNGFLMETQIFNDTARSEKFNKRLEEEIEKTYEIWKEMAMKRWQEVQVKNLSNIQLQNYRRRINSEPNTDQNNFENTIDQKHEQIKTEVVSEFLKASSNKFESEIVQTVERSLEKEIDSTFQEWKKSAVKRRQESQIKSLSSFYFQNYNQRISNESDFNQEDFEAYIVGKNEEFQNDATQKFSKSATNKKFSDEIVQKYRKKLEHEIQETFKAVFSLKMKSFKYFKDLQRQEMRTKLSTIVQTLSYRYESLMNENLDFNAENFSSVLDQKHSIVETQINEEFDDQSKELKAIPLDEFKQELQNRLQQKFFNWKKETLEKFDEYLQKQKEILAKDITILIQIYTFKYDELMTENISIIDTNFEEMIDNKHKVMKKRILDDFTTKAPFSDNSFKNELEDKIENIFQAFRQRKTREHKIAVEQQKILTNLKIEATIAKKLLEYKETMESYSDYKQKNFELWLQTKHETTKQEIVNNFRNLPEFSKSANQDESLEKLENEIDKAFVTIKPSKLQDYESFKDFEQQRMQVKLKMINQNLLYTFETLINENVDFKVENFSSTLDQKYEEVKDQIFQTFHNQSQEFISTEVDEFKEELEEGLEVKFNVWRDDKLEKYEEYLKRQEEILRKDMTILIQNYAFKYEGLIVENLSFNRTNFESYLNSKHKKIKQKLLEDFTVEAKTSDKTFVLELDKTLEKSFTIFKQKKIIEYKKALQQEQILLNLRQNAKIDKHLFEYKELMEQNIDYKLDNFGSFLLEKHKKTKLQIIEIFSNLTEISESPNPVENREKLEAEIEEAFKTFKPLKMKQRHKVQVESLANHYLQIYQQKINEENDFNVKNFTDYIEGKHTQFKAEAVKEFLKLTVKKFDNEIVQKIHKDLENEMDSVFQKLKPSKISSYENFQASELQKMETKLTSIVKDSLQDYENWLDKNLDFKTKNFSDSINYCERTGKSFIGKRFTNKTLEFKHEHTIVGKFRKELEDEMEKYFLGWKDEKSKKYEEYLKDQNELLRKEMNILIQKFTFRYEQFIVENLSFDAANFEELIDAKHKKVKQKILNEFLKESKTSDKTFIQELEAEIEKSFQDLRQKKVREHKNAMQILLKQKIDALIEGKVNEYKKTMESKHEYTRSDFESWLQRRHNREKPSLLQSFSFLLSKEKPDSQTITKAKERLTNEIDQAFVNIKQASMQHWQEVHTKTLFNSQFQIYQQKTNSESDLDQENFEAHIDEIHHKNKAEAIQEFKRLTADKIDTEIVEKMKSALEEEIDNTFRIFRPSKLRDHQNYKVLQNERLRNKLTMIVQDLLFQLEVNENLDFNDENFSTTLVQRCNEARNQIFAKFELQSKEFKSNLVAEFQQELQTKLNKRLDAWTKQKMEKYDEHVQKKKEILQNEMKILIQKYAFKYDRLINENLSFDQSNFEAYLKEKHQKIKQKILIDFENESQTSDKTFSQELVTKLETNFESFRRIKMDEYKKEMERKRNMEIDAFLESLVNSQLEIFENNLKAGIIYGSDTFEKEILDKYYDCTKNATREFNNATNNPEYKLKKGASFTKLREGIEKSFGLWKTMASAENARILEENRKNKEAEASDLVDSKFANFKIKIGEVTYGIENYYNESFEFNIRKDFEAVKESIVKEFKSDTDEFIESSIQKRAINDLTKKIDSCYDTWKADIMTMKLKYDNNNKVEGNQKLETIADLMVEEYRMEARKEFPKQSSLSAINETHHSLKKKAVSSFLYAATSNITDAAIIQNNRITLERQIDAVYKTLKTDETDDQIKIRTIGKWISWQGSSSSYPSFAVTSGGCAIVEHDGRAGRWCKSSSIAEINFDGSYRTFSNFKVLQHSKAKFIPGYQSGKAITINGQQICKCSSEFGYVQSENCYYITTKTRTKTEKRSRTISRWYWTSYVEYYDYNYNEDYRDADYTHLRHCEYLVFDESKKI